MAFNWDDVPDRSLETDARSGSMAEFKMECMLFFQQVVGSIRLPDWGNALQLQCILSKTVDVVGLRLMAHLRVDCPGGGVDEPEPRPMYTGMSVVAGLCSTPTG